MEETIRRVLATIDKHNYKKEDEYALSFVRKAGVERLQDIVASMFFPNREERIEELVRLLDEVDYHLEYFLDSADGYVQFHDYHKLLNK